LTFITKVWPIYIALLLSFVIYSKGSTKKTPIPNPKDAGGST
jgi:hypothetical protein